MKPKITFVIIIILLVMLVFLGVKYFAVSREIGRVQTVLSERKTNEKILAFTQLFVEKVLKAENEIDFETRLKLENSVRGLNDPAILAQWQKFTGSKTESQAQIETKNFLEILIKKVNAQ